jgi:hypothetical protein
MNSSSPISATSVGNYQRGNGRENCYFARLMTPADVALATTRQPLEVRQKTEGHWVLCGDVSTPMFSLLSEVLAANFPVRLTAFTTPIGGSYCVFTHQVQRHQSRLVFSLQDTPVKAFLESVSGTGRVTFSLGNDHGNESLLLACPLKPITFLPLLAMTSKVSLVEQSDTLQELPMVMESMLNSLQVPSMLPGYSVMHVSASLLLPAILDEEFRGLLTKAVGP